MLLGTRTLDKEQQQVADVVLKDKKNACVMAVPGAGKTWIGIYIAWSAYLIRKSRTMLMTFNTLLKEEVGKRILEFPTRPELPSPETPEDRVNSENYHSLSLACVLAVRKHLEQSTDVDGSSDTIIQHAIDLILERTYSDIILPIVSRSIWILDEAQDMKPIFFRLLTAIFQLLHANGIFPSVVLMGDVFQTLYDKVMLELLMDPNTHWGSLLGNFVEMRLSTTYRMHPLLVNLFMTHLNPCRTPEILARFGDAKRQALVRKCWGDGIRAGELRSPGPPPILIFDKDSMHDNRVVSKVVNAYHSKMEKVYGKKNCLVLSNSTADRSAAFYIVNESSFRGHSWVVWNRMSSGTWRQAISSLTFVSEDGETLTKAVSPFYSGQHNILTTCFQVKGCETKAVMVLDFNSRNVDLGADPFEEFRKIWTQASRASSQLVLVCSTENGKQGPFFTFDMDKAREQELKKELLVLGTLPPKDPLFVSQPVLVSSQQRRALQKTITVSQLVDYVDSLTKMFDSGFYTVAAQSIYDADAQDEEEEEEEEEEEQTEVPAIPMSMALDMLVLALEHLDRKATMRLIRDSIGDVLALELTHFRLSKTRAMKEVAKQMAAELESAQMAEFDLSQTKDTVPRWTVFALVCAVRRCLVSESIAPWLEFQATKKDVGIPFFRQCWERTQEALRTLTKTREKSKVIGLTRVGFRNANVVSLSQPSIQSRQVPGQPEVIPVLEDCYHVITGTDMVVDVLLESTPDSFSRHATEMFQLLARHAQNKKDNSLAVLILPMAKQSWSVGLSRLEPDEFVFFAVMRKLGFDVDDPEIQDEWTELSARRGAAKAALGRKRGREGREEVCSLIKRERC